MSSGPRRKGRQLSPEEKWQGFLEVTSQQLSQADAARKWGVDVSTVIKLRRLAKDAALAAFAAAKPGRPRRSSRSSWRGCGPRRQALGSDQGAGGGALAAPGKAALELFGPV